MLEHSKGFPYQVQFPIFQNIKKKQETKLQITSILKIMQRFEKSQNVRFQYYIQMCTIFARMCLLQGMSENELQEIIKKDFPDDYQQMIIQMKDEKIIPENIKRRIYPLEINNLEIIDQEGIEKLVFKTSFNVLEKENSVIIDHLDGLNGSYIPITNQIVINYSSYFQMEVTFFHEKMHQLYGVYIQNIFIIEHLQREYNSQFDTLIIILQDMINNSQFCNDDKEILKKQLHGYTLYTKPNEKFEEKFVRIGAVCDKLYRNVTTQKMVFQSEFIEKRNNDIANMYVYMQQFLCNIQNKESPNTRILPEYINILNQNASLQKVQNQSNNLF